MGRRAGKTTQQILSAPAGAIFVWVSGDVSYPKRLAEELGRRDLTFVGPSFASSEKWRGFDREIVADHAVWDHLTNSNERGAFSEMLAYFKYKNQCRLAAETSK